MPNQRGPSIRNILPTATPALLFIPGGFIKRLLYPEIQQLPPHFNHSRDNRRTLESPTNNNNKKIQLHFLWFYYFLAVVRPTFMDWVIMIILIMPMASKPGKTIQPWTLIALKTISVMTALCFVWIISLLLRWWSTWGGQDKNIHWLCFLFRSYVYLGKELKNKWKGQNFISGWVGGGGKILVIFYLSFPLDIWWENKYPVYWRVRRVRISH